MDPANPSRTSLQHWQRRARRLRRWGLLYRRDARLTQRLSAFIAEAQHCIDLQSLTLPLRTLLQAWPRVDRAYLLPCSPDLPPLSLIEPADNPATLAPLGEEHPLIPRLQPAQGEVLPFGTATRTTLDSPLSTAPAHGVLAPLHQDAALIGVLGVESLHPRRPFRRRDRQRLALLAQVIIAVYARQQRQQLSEQALNQRTHQLRLANQALHEELRQRRRAELLQNTLLTITELTAGHTDIDAFYPAIHQALAQLLHADNCFIALQDEHSSTIHYPYFRADGLLVHPVSHAPTDGLTEQILNEGEPLHLTGVELRQAYQKGEIGRDTDVCLLNVGDLLGVPLTIGGRRRGVLMVFSQHNWIMYDQKDLELLSFVSQHICTAIERREHASQQLRQHIELERKVAERTREMQRLNSNLQRQILQRRQAEDRLRYDAFHDTLTALPNRALLLNRLEQALRHQRRHPKDRFALLFIDLDRFKQVNDSFGHLLGDQYLVEIARRLGSGIRENDTLARLGGDEFVILLDRIGEKPRVEEICERLLQTVSTPLLLEGYTLYPALSIGVTLVEEREKPDAESLLRQADTALYQAKANGRGGYTFYQPRMDLDNQLTVGREAQFRQALAKQDIEVHYQPIVDLDSGRWIGLEALARWNHPDWGQIPPADFLPWASQCGAITELDHYVLQRIERDRMALLPLLGPQGTLQINLDLSHLRNPHQLNQLVQAVRELRLPSERLALEFSERDLLVDQATLVAGLGVLKAAGVKLGLDDFGTGYSALTLLPSLPLDYIKIDRTYCLRLNNSERHRAIIQSLIGLSKDLDLLIAAEGLETEDQVRCLQALGCRWGQGYRFGAPQPLAALADAARTPCTLACPS